MAPRKIREVMGAVKDKTSISLAMVASSSSSLSDLEVAIVRATRHGQNLPNQGYIAEILSLTRYSRNMVNACIRIIARRLNRTKDWVVALKGLLLVQRLLSQSGTAFEQEMFFATRRGTRFLNMCDFRDSSRKAWDYSAFVRMYALYLDELLEFRMQGHTERGRDHGHYKAEEEEDGDFNDVVVRATPVSEMDNDAVFRRVDHLMQLLERFLACRPTGGAKHSRIVVVALYPILKESFEIYHCITEILGTLIERFMQLEVPDMIQVHDIFSHISKQYDELDCFYNWCKNVGIMRLPDYPNVEKINQPKLDMMKDFIRHKSSMMNNRNAIEPKPANTEVAWKEPEKALSPIQEETAGEVNVTPEPQQGEKTQEEGDLLNLYDDAPTPQDFGDQLALALFDGYPSTTAPVSTSPPWEAFKESESGDWETALVQSASHLSNQKPSLPQGFDPLILDSMYQYGAMTHVGASSGYYATGSASSVALGSAGRPAILALPAPRSPANCGVNTFSPNNDPFAASLAIAPPSYVQMSEMEKKQRLLLQEQLLWQQYTRDGMHGQVGFANLQQQNSHQYIPNVYAAAW
ncbi:putative clathrin assembly protein At4g02650 [Salvia hispanica]|uniref:putative clathrin assembly protein At4g02650 n=1 Tax=Salvia hispanica TaxID=49212 RepID=UPI002009780B|nr:putative clathrin assembly protein At4g02650 [Salvia hispanica]XP_047981281.1 putative clathrin assembly protein At4g02650 [Salvia hispanica]